ncbi:MAG: hypothetical protein HY756_03955 [Nitrospirae bacterium]|nr:hypothetical protein [Nitrospirota bacterium]
MYILRLLLILLAASLFIPACTQAGSKENKQPVFKEVPQIQEIKPEKPPKIKLKRNAKDDYSWEISGEDVDEVIKIDRRLKSKLKPE